MNPFYIVGGALIALFLFFFLFGYFCFHTACVSPRRRSADQREHGKADLPPLLSEAYAWYDAQEFEEVAVCSHDELHLRGALLMAKGEAKGAVLLFHGYHSSPRRDFALHAKLLHEEGYHLLLPDQRSHGKSEGRYICFGAKESLDAAAWCRFAVSRLGEELPLALMGISMGAATVMMASDKPLPQSVRCVVADCGFTTPWEIIKRRLLRKHKILPYPVIYFMNYWSRMLAGFDYRADSSAESVKRSSLPVLLIHGEADRYVPAEMSRRIQDARPDAELLTVPNAPHARALLTDPEGYKAELLDFLRENCR